MKRWMKRWMWISFETWNHQSTTRFLWDRFYLNGWRWTPFVFVRRRYLVLDDREVAR